MYGEYKGLSQQQITYIEDSNDITEITNQQGEEYDADQHNNNENEQQDANEDPGEHQPEEQP